MSKRIIITHTDNVSSYVALFAAYMAKKHHLSKGEAITIMDGKFGVEYRNTKTECFYVWGREEEQ